MIIDEIRRLLDAKVLLGEDKLSEEVLSACASDMMSDVLAFPKEHMALLTGLVNPQVLRTADMLDIRLIVFVRGKIPGPEVMKLAEEYDACVLTTRHTLFVASGILYTHGLSQVAKG